MLKNCLQKLGKQISSIDREEIEGYYDAHAARGLSEYEASAAALSDWHKGLHTSVNELRASVGLKPVEYKAFVAAKAESSVQAESPIAQPAKKTKQNRIEVDNHNVFRAEAPNGKPLWAVRAKDSSALTGMFSAEKFTAEQAVTEFKKQNAKESTEKEVVETPSKPIDPRTEKLGEVGKYGQVSSRLRKNGFTSDPAVIKAVTGKESVEDTQNGLLDAIAQSVGVGRSSQITPELWNKWLDDNADKLPIESIKRIEDALSHQEDFNKRITAFTSDKGLKEILDTVDLSAVTSFKSLPLKTRSAILKLGREQQYGFSDKTIKETFDRGLSQALAGSDAGRTSRAESTQSGIQNQGTQAADEGNTAQEVDERATLYSKSKAIGDSLNLENLDPENLYSIARMEPHSVNHRGIKIKRTHAEILRRVEGKLDIESGRKQEGDKFPHFRGQHISANRAKKVAIKLREIGKSRPDYADYLNAFADNLIEVAHRDGSVVIYTTESPTTKFHEGHHQASYLASHGVALEDVVNVEEGSSRPEFGKAREKLLEIGYSDHPPTILEEMMAHLNEGKPDILGLTQKEASDFSVWWYNSFTEQGHDLNHPIFDRVIHENKGALRYVRNQRSNEKWYREQADEARNRLAEQQGAGERPDTLQDDRGTGERDEPRRTETVSRDTGTLDFQPLVKPENTALVKAEQADTDEFSSRDEILLARANEPTPEETKALTTRLWNQIYEGRGKDATPKTEVLVNFRRAGLLTNPSTHLRNLASNTVNQISEEAIRPIALLADLAASAVTGKRTVQAPSVKGVWNSFSALVKADPGMKKLNLESGISRAVNLLVNGDMKELEKNQLAEMRSGSPLVDKLVNYTFRALGAEDALFKTYAIRRSLEEQAKTLAITESREKKFDKYGTRRAWIAARRAELLKDPSKDMLLEATLYADFTTYTNRNPISDAFRATKEGIAKVSPVAKGIVEIAVPYDKTPTNIVLRTLEHSPLGLGWAAKHLLDLKRGKSYTFAKMREDFEKNWEAVDRNREATRGLLGTKIITLLDDGGKLEKDIEKLLNKTDRTMAESRRLLRLQNGVDVKRGKLNVYAQIRNRRKLKDYWRESDRRQIEEAMDKLFPRIQQQMFARSFGRAGLGSALLALGMILAWKGLLSGLWDSGDEEEKGEFWDRKDKGILNGALQIGSRRYQIADSPSGKQLALGASLWERSAKPKKDDETEAEKKLNDTFSVTENLIMEQPMLNTMNDYFGSKKTKEKRISGLLGSFMPAIIASTADIIDPEARDNSHWYSGLMNKTPGVSTYNDKAKFPREPYLQDRSGRIRDKIDPFKSRPVTEELPGFVKPLTQQQKVDQIKALESLRDKTKNPKVRDTFQRRIDELR
jgi:hypothetical protein